jgi:hypothetical protein
VLQSGEIDDTDYICERTKSFLVSERNASKYTWVPGNTPTSFYSGTANDLDCNAAEGSSLVWFAAHGTDIFGNFTYGAASGTSATFSTSYAYPKHISVYNGEVLVMSRNDGTLHRYDFLGNSLGTVPAGAATGQGVATDGEDVFVGAWTGTASQFIRYNSSYVSQGTIANPSGLSGNNIFDFAYDLGSGHFFGLVTTGEGGTGTSSTTVVEFEMGGAVVDTFTLPFSADGIGQNNCQ